MKRIISLSMFILLTSFLLRASLTAPTVELKGTNYLVANLTNGQKVFLDRIYLFANIPVDLQGWNFTQVAGTSNPHADILLKASEDGYIYTLVASDDGAATTTTANQWAIDNGWEKSAYFMTYSTPTPTTLNLFRKPCVKDVWVTIVQPKIFSGAMICAPIITNSTSLIVSTNTNLSTLTLTTASDIAVLVKGTTLTVDASTTVNSISAASGAKITLNAGNTITVGTFNIQSDATNGTATFVDNGGTLSATTINVQQYLTSGRNWYISSPISGATTGALSSATSVVSYNEPTATWTPESGSTLTPMKGYISALTKTNGTITFTGTPLNTGSQSILLTRTKDAIKQGFNLVGNPYPSYLNWDLATKTNLVSTMWYRTQNTLGTNVFDTYGATAGIGTNNNLIAAVTANIPPMQAFWVRVAASGDGSSTTGTLTVNNTMRSHNDVSTNKFRAPSLINESQKVLHLQVSNGLNSDEAIVLFNKNASDSLDAYDSPKMTNSNVAIPEIYTVAGNEELVINGLHDLTPTTEVALGFRTGENNTDFAIKATAINNFDTDTRVILKDNQLNVDKDITDGTAYNFTSDAVTTTNRFSIIFKSSSVSTYIESNNANNNILSVYKNANGQIAINCANGMIGSSTVTVYNMVGQKLGTKLLTNTTTVLNKSYISGVYLVSVIANGKTITRKVIIN